VAEYEVYIHSVEDVGHETSLDLDEFPPFDPDAEEKEFGRLFGAAEDSMVSLITAEERTGVMCRAQDMLDALSS
jgi:hypothetical protein